MSKLSNRDAIKNLSSLNIDCQYVYQIGLKIFNFDGQHVEERRELCDNFKGACDDIVKELEAVKKLIPIE